MKCPICEKSFSSISTLTSHLDLHKQESILESSYIKENNYQKTTNDLTTSHGKLFRKEKFEKITSEKINSITDVEELVFRNRFVEQMAKITADHPFVYMPYFIEDLINGRDSSEIMKKYFIADHMDLKSIVQGTLNFQGNRYRQKQLFSARPSNMKIPGWKDNYDAIIDNCEFFMPELQQLLFDNFLVSYIILIMTDFSENGINKEDLESKSTTLKDNYDIFHFVDDSLSKSLEKYFGLEFQKIFDGICAELTRKDIIIRKYGSSNMFTKLSIDEIKKELIRELKFNRGNLNERTLYRNVKNAMPILALVPQIGLLETAISELEKDGIINTDSKINFRGSGIVYLNENYQRIQQKLKSFDNIPMEFFGRKISPERFIEELKELEKGDFSDKDDQVTRIAGLVLAESVKLQSPHEDISGFDFSINIKNYNFRPEQLEAISRLNFQITSDIFHCKVMIDEVLTLQGYEELKNSLPDGEQGVVVTFKRIPDSVKQRIARDPSIQIIDEEGIKTWVSITPKIPSRKNSIAKLRFDPVSKLEKKIVKIDYIDYENGLATVSIIPKMTESTVLIRSLEEITLNETSPKEFESLSLDYLKFLRLLADLTRDVDFVDGMFNQKILDIKFKDHSKTAFELDHHKVFINLKGYDRSNILNCSCLKWVEYRLFLCPHIISALDYIYREFSLPRKAWDDNSNEIRKSLEMTIKGNISMILERFDISIDYKNDEIHGDKRITDFVYGILKIKENP